MDSSISWLRAEVISCLLVGLIVLTPPLLSAASEKQTSQPPQNMALGKQYKLWPAPNYPHCTDPGDVVQLTDGKTTKDYFWTQKGTVGWTSAPYVTITVDLGKDEPIGGVAFDTAAGVAGVEWPTAINILTSSDGKVYHNTGDLVALDQRLNGPWPKGYRIRRLEARGLKTHGRYVQFLVTGQPFIFCNEVEVFRGPDLLLTQPAGAEVPDAKELFQARKVGSAISRRYRADAESLETVVRGAHLPTSVESRLLNHLSEVRRKLEKAALEPHPTQFRAVLPFGKEHEQLFALQAELWREAGHPALSAWVPGPWNPVPLFGLLPKTAGEIEVGLMRGEYRCAAVNLAYGGSEPLQVALRIEESSPGSGVLRKVIRLHDVQWTDTSVGEPVASALRKLPWGPTGATLSVTPGLVRQLWLTFHVDLPVAAGRYEGHLIFDARDHGRTTIRLPIRLRVYPINFPKETTLWLGGWCYTNGNGNLGVTATNRSAFLRHLREHFVNCPWATSEVMTSCTFPPDSDKVEVDTRNMDAWLAQWPGAKRYMVFLAVDQSFGGAPFDSPQFSRRVKAWISAWVSHLQTKGVPPDKLCVLLHDEPHAGTDIAPMVAWARAIHAVAPKVVIWEDPTYEDPSKAPAELFDVSQILCPNRPMWLTGGDKFAQVYLEQQRRGRTLQFYSCSGPAKVLDPYSYYRLQAWHCWQIGATGSWFWAFGDNAGSSSWNEYLAVAGPYTPLFLDDTSVVAGKQMEAIRESVEDYEYFVMLRQAILKAKATARSEVEIDRAEALLRDGVQRVLKAPGADKLFWRDPKDRGQADAVRLEILQAVEQV